MAIKWTPLSAHSINNLAFLTSIWHKIRNVWPKIFGNRLNSCVAFSSAAVFVVKHLFFSASEVTTLWRYTNMLIYLYLLLFFILPELPLSCSVCDFIIKHIRCSLISRNHFKLEFPFSRDVVLGTRTRTRVQLEYKFLVLVLVLVLIDRVLVLVLVLVTTVLVLVRTVLVAYS